MKIAILGTSMVRTRLGGQLSQAGHEGQVIDLGGIETSTVSEHYGLLFLALMSALGTPIFNVKVVR